MVTAKEIREVRFSRGMRGYDTTEVDAFLDQCTAAVETLTAEKEESTRKMQVLAETIMDYRKQEDSIRSAVLNAQRMSDQVVADARREAEQTVADAKAQAEQILAEAKAQADIMRSDTQRSIVEEREELVNVKREVAAFKDRLMSMYREHLRQIGVLPDEDPDDAPAKRTEQPTPKAEPAPEPKTAPQPEPAAPAPQPEQPAEPAYAAAYSVSDGDGPEEQPQLDLSAFRFEEDQ